MEPAPLLLLLIASVATAPEGDSVTLGSANLTVPQTLAEDQVQPQTALDDVTMEDETPCSQGHTSTHPCHEVCKCENGRLVCTPRCTGSLIRSNLSSPDPNCHLQPVDQCCSILLCNQNTNSNTKEEMASGCIYNNQTYHHGESFNVECTSVCLCTKNGKVVCRPRCPLTNVTNSDSERCLKVADSKDPCCMILYCDVNASEEIVLDDGEGENAELNIVSAVPANNTAVILNFDSLMAPEEIHVEISEDEKSWISAKTFGHTVLDLLPGKTYNFRVISRTGISNTVSITLPSLSMNASMCEYKGKTYKKGSEFHDECLAYCICLERGVECATIECPTDFGLDVLDPLCLKWETRPDNFKPTPPHCCPESIVCKNNGSCSYKGQLFENWADIPSRVSGCDLKCFCQAGNVSCMPRCPPVPAVSPQDLRCRLDAIPVLANTPDDSCCLQWMCPLHNDSITVHTLEAINENTVRLMFSVPIVLVGLHGRVELRYSSENKDSDPSTWEQKVLAPYNDLIATPQLEFELEDLKPDTEYKMKITVVMRDLQNSISSQILLIKTPPSASTTSPPIIPVEPDLRVSNINSTFATLSWRKFTEMEMQYVDGVQLRYKEIEGKVYQATPLIHRAVTSYTIADLKPESQYEIGIFFIPFPGQTTELQAQKTIRFSTTIENDPYKFELTLDVNHIKSTSVSLSWSGVPYPEDKYVNIFRAIYQYEGEREDMNSFKVAKRDSPAGTLIHGLKPNTRYRLWIEAYLTNGRIKKSNVKDFTTKKAQGISADINQGKLEGASLAQGNDYYGPLIGVSILAGVAILAAVSLLVLVARKHGHNKAPITSAVQRKPPPQSHPHTQTAAYDNPSYKSCDGDTTSGGRIPQSNLTNEP